MGCEINGPRARRNVMKPILSTQEAEKPRRYLEGCSKPIAWCHGLTFPNHESPQKPVKAVVFDFDGTLVDTVDLLSEAWARAAGRLGITVSPNEVKRYVGLAGPEISLEIAGGDSAKAAELRKIKDEIYESEYVSSIRFFDDAEQSLKRLRENGLKIAVASSQASKRLKRYLSLLGIITIVDAIVGSDAVSRRKPAPDVFLKAAELLKVKPEECFAVGDTCFDCESAGRAGMRFILVSRRSTYCENAEFTVKSLNEAASIILSMR